MGALAIGGGRTTGFGGSGGVLVAGLGPDPQAVTHVKTKATVWKRTTLAL